MRPGPIIVVVPLVLAACGGGSNKSSGGGAAAPPTVVSTSAVAPSGGPGPADTAATTSMAPRTGATGGKTGAAPTSAPVTTATKQQPVYATGAAPGKYVYDVSGSASGSLDPSQRPVSGRSVLTVDPRQGDDQRSATVSDLSSRPPSEQVIRFLPEGVHLLRLRVGGGLSEFAASPPVLAAPTPPFEQPWSWSLRSTDGTTTLAGSFRYRGTDTVTVGGQSVPSYVIDGELRFSGAIVGIVEVTRWVSLVHSLDVKTHEAADFTSPMRSRDDLTFALQSLTPS